MYNYRFYGWIKNKSYITDTVKPAHVITSIKQSPVLKGHLFLSSFKRSFVI